MKSQSFLNIFTIFNQLHNFHCLLLPSPNVSRAFQFRSCKKNFLVCLRHLFENAKTFNPITMLVHCLTYRSFFCSDETHTCVILPYLLHQHTRRNHRHVVTHRCLVIAHLLLNATYKRAFQELNCHTLYVNGQVKYVF
jgi:hypothetical protein